MKKIIIFILLMSTFLNAQETDKKDVPIAPAKKKVIVLPFYDYTSSDMEYLQTLIPEKIVENLKFTDKYILVSGIEDLDFLKSQGLFKYSLFDSRKIKQFLQKNGYDFAIAGRYLIHEKTFKINYKAIFANADTETKYYDQEGIIADGFLDRIDFFTTSTNKWMKDVFPEVYSRYVPENEAIFGLIVEWIGKTAIGGILTNKWVSAFFIVIFFIFISRFVSFIFIRVLAKLAKRTATMVDDNIVEIGRVPVTRVIVLFGLKIAIIYGEFPNSFGFVVGNMLSGIIVLIMIFFLIKVVDILVLEWGKILANSIDSRINEDLVPLFSKVSKAIVIVSGTIMILSIFELEVGPFLASLGVIGFAIGFAIKDTLANIIGGIVLILDHSFAVGDKVTIDGDTGIITEVGFRNTKITNYDHEVIVIPNNELTNKKFKNYVLPDPTIRVVVNFGVSYGSDVDKVEEVVMKVLESVEERCIDPGPIVVFDKMDDFSLNYEAKIWIPSYSDQYSMRIRLTKMVYKALVENDISIPFPTHTVHIEKS